MSVKKYPTKTIGWECVADTPHQLMEPFFTWSFG